jgi:hypothetical protein
MVRQFGIFKFHDKSFTVKLSDGPFEIAWDSITQINVYKIDQLTVDCIAMQIIVNDTALTITEDSLGWDEFTLELEKLLPNIPGDWWQKVAHPPFATNFATIYKK